MIVIDTLQLLSQVKVQQVKASELLQLRQDRQQLSCRHTDSLCEPIAGEVKCLQVLKA